ncbi:MAG: hypothetical protein ACI9QC_000269 [Oceanicoccus sp.]|jgi:hypothetical protein
MLKQIFKKIIQGFNPKLGLMLMLPLALALVMPDYALAAGDPSDIELETLTKIGTALSLVLHLAQSLLWPFLVFIGDLMDSDLIIGPGMEDRLWSIWVQLRDLVNIVFVLVLLVIAFYNTLGIGGGEGNLALKTALPKVVLGLILVNFTFVGGKLLIDVSNVATSAVFALPELAEDFDMENEREDLRLSICVKTEGNEDDLFAIDSSDTPALTQLFCKKQLEEDGTEKYYAQSLSDKAERDYFQRLNKSNISIVMAANMTNINQTQLLKDGAIESVGDLLENLSFSVVMTVVYAISYIALGLVLISRVVVLWIALAFSPIGVLVFVVPQLKDWLGGGGDIVQKLMKHLIAPIVIGIVMSIGYVMIEAWDGVVGGSYLSIAGAEANELLATEVLLTGVTDLSHMIIAVASVVIVWGGVFAASSGTIAGVATDAINGFGKSVGKAALKAPLNLASMPVSYYDKESESWKKQDISALDMINSAKFAIGGLNNTEAGSRERLGRVHGEHSILAGGRPLDRSAKGAAQLNAISQLARTNPSLSDADLSKISSHFESMKENGEITNTHFNEIMEKVKEAKSTENMGVLTSFLASSKDRFDVDDEGKEELDSTIRSLEGTTYTKPTTIPPEDGDPKPEPTVVSEITAGDGTPPQDPPPPAQP